MTLQTDRSAPAFALKNQHGEVVALSDFAGRKNVILVFYPFAFSGVCTGELCELRDRLTDIADDDSEMLAVSCDPMFALRAFADRDGYSFSLLSDFWPHGEVSQAYNIFEDKPGCAGRATYIIDKSGVIRWSVHNEMSQARDLGLYRKILTDINAERTA